MKTISRRQALAAFGALSAALAATPALAREAVQDFMDDLLAAGPVEVDWLRLDVLAVADNANAVPVGLIVEPPEELGVQCEEVLVIAERNPRPAAFRMAFSAAAVPDIATRIRLAETQDVVALAKMSDGSVVMARRPVTVVAGGCGL